MSFGQRAIDVPKRLGKRRVNLWLSRDEYQKVAHMAVDMEVGVEQAAYVVFDIGLGQITTSPRPVIPQNSKSSSSPPEENYV